MTTWLGVKPGQVVIRATIQVLPYVAIFIYINYMKTPRLPWELCYALSTHPHTRGETKLIVIAACSWHN